VRDLKELLGKVSEGGEGKWLVGTACKCHGVITAMQVAQ
jgi:6-phosphogluconate dehydrogenase (decarboxylating)